MRSYNATQDTLVAGNPSLVWLFEIDQGATGSIDYYYSTADYTYGGQSYTAKVLDFNGVRQLRPKTEQESLACLKSSFNISDAGFSLTASDFDDAHVTIRLVASDEDSNEEEMGVWKCLIKRAEREYGKITCTCTDFLQGILEGDYPNTDIVSDLYPSDDEDRSNVCIPIYFGIAYIPIQSFYCPVDSERFYMLGPSTKTYTIYEVHTPKDWGVQCSWKDDGHGGGYDLEDTITTKDTYYKVLSPKIADSDDDGTADATGLWQEGNSLFPMPCKMTRSDTSSITSPDDVLEFVLEDLGISSGDIDTGAGSTFEAAGTTFSGWGLTFNGGWSTKDRRKKRLSSLFEQSHSFPLVTDKIELHVYFKTAVGSNLTKSYLKDFRHSLITKSENDSGYITWQESGTPQDRFVKTLTPAKSATDNPSSETFLVNFVQDDQDVQRIGTLHYQKKYLRYADISFTGRFELMKHQPGDVVSILDDSYGGSYDVMLDVVHVQGNGWLRFEATRYSEALDDWNDLSPSAISIASDDSTNIWSPVIAGPDSNVTDNKVPNQLRGRLRVGATGSYVLLDPGPPIIKLDEGGQDRVKIGDLGTNEYGIEILDHSGNTILKLDSDIDNNQLVGFKATKYTLQADNGAVGINSEVTAGTDWRIWAGNAVPGSAPFRVDSSGNLVAGSATITGDITATTGDLQTLSVSGTLTIGAGGSVVAGDATLDNSGISGTGYSLSVSGLEMTGGSIDINSTAFAVDSSGNVTATSGTIAGFTIDTTDGLYSGSGTTRVQMKSGTGIWLGATAIGDAPFSVDEAGAITATSGNIANFTLATNSFSADGGNFILDSSIPSMTLGSVTDYMTGTGIFQGKHSGVYKMHIGNPSGDHLKFDGTNLYISGDLQTGSTIAGTATNTFTINNDNDDVDVKLILARSTGGSATLSWDGSGVSLNQALTLGSHLTVSGDLTVNGTTFTVNTTTVEIEDNLLVLNAGETGAGVTAGFSGFQVDRGTETDYKWGFNESDDLWKIGEVGSLQAVATRQDAPTNAGIPFWNDSQSRLDNSANATLDSGGNVEANTLILNSGISAITWPDTDNTYSLVVENVGGVLNVAGSIAPYKIHVQDGHGRVSHLWNVDEASGDYTYAVGSEGANWFLISNGSFQLKSASAGTAGNVISWNTAIDIHPDGTVGIGGGADTSYAANIAGAVQVDGDLDFVGAQSITTTSNNLTIAPAGDIELNPTGDDVLPTTGYDINLGSLSKKYLTLHAAELWVETLVAQDTIATIGGRVLVGPTTELTRDLTSGATTIYVKHNQMASGDRAYMETNGKVEFFAITSGATNEGSDYSYSVTRNLDGTGANVWDAGDAMFNTGAADDGFIDLYSYSGVGADSTNGPTIVGNVRNSVTYNDWTTAWAIGNLNGIYGYGTDTYGVGLGKYGADHLVADPSNGLRFRDASDNVLAKLASNEFKVGDATYYLKFDNTNGLKYVGPNASLDIDGSGSLAGGNITWTAGGDAQFTGTVTIGTGSTGVANLGDAGALAQKSTASSSDVDFNFADSTSKGGNAKDTDAVNGTSSSTIISGGLIQTGVLTANNIQAGTLDANYVTVQSQDTTTFSLSGNNLAIDTNQFTLDASGNADFAGSLAVGSLPNFPSDANLVGYWSFDGGNATDNSLNGNDGTLVNSPTVVDIGVSGKCYAFDSYSSELISIPDDLADVSNNFSVSLFCYLSSTYSGTQSETINPRAFGLIGTEKIQICMRNRSKFEVRIVDASDTELVSQETTAGFSEDTWYHVVVSWSSGNTLKIYVDGEEQTLTSGAITGTVRSAIGAGITSGNFGWHGYVDEVRVYKTVLEATQAKSLYLNPGGPKHGIISADQIRTGKIESSNTSVYWDLDNSTFYMPAGSANIAGVTIDSIENNATNGATFGSNMSGGGTGNNQVGNDGLITILSADIVSTGTMSANRVRTGTLQDSGSNVVFDLTAATLTINKASGLVVDSSEGVTVNNGGSVELNAGGDLILTGHDTDNKSLIKIGLDHDIEIGGAITERWTGIWTQNSTNSKFTIGLEPYDTGSGVVELDRHFKDIHVYSSNETKFSVVSSYNDGIIQITDNKIDLSTSYNSNTKYTELLLTSDESGGTEYNRFHLKFNSTYVIVINDLTVDNIFTIAQGYRPRIEEGELEIKKLSSGDPIVTYDIGGTAKFTHGVDDSDSDKFKIDSGGALTASSLFEMDSSGNVVTGGSLSKNGSTSAQEVHGYVDRGDPASVDYNDASDLTIDNSYHDLDLSSIIDSNAVLVLLRVKLQGSDASGTDYAFFRKNGNSSQTSGPAVSSYEKVYRYQEVLVVPDSNGLIEYKVTACDELTITVAGWWV